MHVFFTKSKGKLQCQYSIRNSLFTIACFNIAFKPKKLPFKLLGYSMVNSRIRKPGGNFIDNPSILNHVTTYTCMKKKQMTNLLTKQPYKFQTIVAQYSKCIAIVAHHS